MNLNKNISIWRGNNTPPSQYHLWLRGDKIYHNNGIEWVENKVDVDSVLSDTSTNPVQNKLIKAALDELNVKLSWKLID